MNNKKKLCIGLGFSLLTIGVAHAQTTTEVSGTVREIYDPYGVVTGIQVGDTISGQYVYESTTVDQDPNPDHGEFKHVSGAGSMNLSLGAYQFQTDPGSFTPLEVYVDNDAWGSGWENYHAVSFDVMPTNGVMVDYVNINLGGDGGNALADDQLHDVPPDMMAFNSMRSINVGGFKDGYYFSVTADLQSFDVAGTSAEATLPNTFKVIAQVGFLDDYSGQLAGHVAQGDFVTLYYTLDPNTPDLEPDPEIGNYQHALDSGSMRFELPDGTVVESVSAHPTLQENVFNHSYSDFIDVHSSQMVSSDASLDVMDGWIYFDGPAHMIQNDSMNLDSMLANGWVNNRLGLGSGSWWFEADVVSIERLPIKSVEVVPGDARIHFAQRFDMAAYLTYYANINAVAGTLNGMPIDTYLSGCMIDLPVNNSQAMVCPDMHNLLAPGQNVLQLNFILDDQSIVNTTVEWNKQ